MNSMPKSLLSAEREKGDVLHRVNLGKHWLELLRDQSLLLEEQTSSGQPLRLEKEESYRLYLMLLEMFREEMSQEAGEESADAAC